VEFKALLEYAQVGLIVGQAVVLFALFLLKSTFATRKDLGGAIDLGSDAHHRLDLLEQRVAQLPNHQDINVLADRIGSLDKAAARLEEQVNGLERTTSSIDGAVARIEQHLLDMKRAA
jgi:septal ring factor EnvC (AmiA/AmiB activator)